MDCFEYFGVRCIDMSQSNNKTCFMVISCAILVHEFYFLQFSSILLRMSELLYSALERSCEVVFVHIYVVNDSNLCFQGDL